MFKPMKSTSLLMAAALGMGLAIAPAAQADMVKTYTTYDANSDGYWTEDEFRTYTYSTIDYDNDGRINESEWRDYTNVWYSPYDETNTVTFAKYDTNRDGYVTNREYNSAYDYNLFNTWDTNQNDRLERGEYKTVVNMYENYDRDNLYTW